MTEQKPNHLSDIYLSIKNGMTPVHPEGKRFALIAAIAGLVLSWLWYPFAWVGVIAALYCLYFFRDPTRITPPGDNLVISPADGVIHKIVQTIPPVSLGMGAAPLTRISVFLNVFDVHINRIPVTGKVVAEEYRPGTFFNAELDKASEENERQCVTIEHVKGKVGLVQIAGLIARRIICNLETGDSVTAGQRYGLIRFGSRVDVYLPVGAKVKVLVGQRSIGGETVLAEF